jgi:RimJ/RimL family protein N-acetyltransferase
MRPHTLEDFGESAALWGDPVVTRHIGGRPFTNEEVWARLLRYAGHWGLLGFGYWVVREKATGRFVGEVGFADFKRDLEPSFGSSPEIGWVLSPWAHGKGFATEAVRAALAFGEAHFEWRDTVCMINPENAASIRVAEKCGYVEFARTTYKIGTVILYRRSV